MGGHGGTSDTIKYRVKEAVGALTGDQRLKNEGKLDQTIGKVKGAVERVINKAKNVVKGPTKKIVYSGFRRATAEEPLRLSRCA